MPKSPPPVSAAKAILLNARPLHRVLIGLLPCLFTFWGTWHTGLTPLLQAMLLWNVFAFTYLLLSWIIFLHHSPEDIRKRAAREDGSRFFVLLIVVIASFASMFTILLLMLSREVSQTAQIVYLPIAIGGMLLSWMMVHTTFGFHYAHLYYSNDADPSTPHTSGLDFPGGQQPDYLDFAYFAFGIGMTFQVSDVAIRTRRIRRQVLLHSLLSFGLNTFVVALTINLVAGLKNG